jgi:hypothetical protein
MATAFAHMPQSTQVWLRFAHSPPATASGRAQLGSFCTFHLFVGWASPPDIRLRGPKLGSFCTFHSPAEPRPTRQLPLPTYPSPAKFGFVSHVYSPAGAKLGSFCTPSSLKCEVCRLKSETARSRLSDSTLETSDFQLDTHSSIDVSRAPYVVQKPKNLPRFIPPRKSRMSPFRLPVARKEWLTQSHQDH